MASKSPGVKQVELRVCLPNPDGETLHCHLSHAESAEGAAGKVIRAI